MAFRYRSRDIRLYIGGDPVHGLTDDARTLRTLTTGSTRPAFNRTSIGDGVGRRGLMRYADGVLSVSGWADDHYGLRPAVDRAVVDDLPVTVSVEGGEAGSISTIAAAGAWRSVGTGSPDTEPTGITSEASLSSPADALCLFEGRINGGGEQSSPGLSQVTMPIPIRTVSPRLEIVSGNQQFEFEMRAEDASRYLMEDDYIQFVTGSVLSQITGTYRVDNIQTAGGVAWSNVFASRVPPVDLTTLFAAVGPRNSPDGIIIQDTFRGNRAALVHLSDLRRRDAVTIAVALQGQAPGQSTWNTIGSEQTAPIPTADGADAAFQRAFYFAVPEETRNLNNVRALVTFRTSANVPGARTDYQAQVRADFAPRFIHHA